MIVSKAMRQPEVNLAPMLPSHPDPTQLSQYAGRR